MTFKTTYILFGILALVLIVFGVSVFWLNPLPPQTDAFVLPSAHDSKDPVDVDQITSVEIERKDPAEKIVLVKDPETRHWKMTEPRELEANDSEVRELIRQVLSAKREENAKPGSPQQHKLDPPQAVVTLKKGDERTFTVNIGEHTGGDQFAVIYVTSSDRPKETMVVAKRDLDEVLKPVNAFRNRDLLTPASGDIQEITLSLTKDGKEKGRPIKLVKKKDRWVYEEPFTGEADSVGASSVPATGQPPSNIQTLLNELTDLRVEYSSEKDSDFVADGVEDLAKYDLGDQDEVLKVGIKKSAANNQTVPVAVLIGVGKKVGDKSDKFYARRAGTNNVVRVAAKNVEPLLQLVESPDALRDRHLVAFEAGRTPDVIRIKNDYGTIEFFKLANKPWQMLRDGKLISVDDQRVQGLVNLLTQDKQVESFPDPKTTKEADLGLDRPSATISVWVDGIEKSDDKKDEKKDDKEKQDDKEKKDDKPKIKDPDKPTVTVFFGKQDREKGTVAAKREQQGEPASLVRVKAVVFEQVSEGPLAYFDRRLPKYNPGDFLKPAENVTRLELQQGEKMTVLVREGKEAKQETPWKFEAPKALAGRSADPGLVDAILRDLNELTAVKLVKEKPSDEELTKDYGLKPAQTVVRITVTKDGKPQVYEYDFGKQTDLGVYAKQAGAFDRTMVFVADKGLLSTLDRDLLDHTVFNFDPTKVTALKLIGWQDVIGAPFTLELTRKDKGAWEVVTPKNYKLDTGKVDQFVNRLSHLRAEKFVSHGAKPDPKQGLEVEDGALKIAITVDKEKPVLLTIGKPDGDKGFFATSDKLPGDIFLVGKTPFEEIKKGSKYFSQ
jgi:hypothetical protein